MSTHSPQEFVIPARPAVLLQLSSLVENGSPGYDQVSELVKSDAALYSNILAMINSAYFGIRTRVSSVDKAVRILGMKRLLLLVRMAALRNVVGDQDNLEQFWDEACEVATMCGQLTHYLPYMAGDDAYTMGMMHACGVPLMVKQYKDYQRLLEESVLLDLSDQQRLEQSHFKVDHFQLSSLIAQRWQIPEPICNAIALQPNYQDVLVDDGYSEELRNQLCLLLIGREFSLKFETLWGLAEEYQPVVNMEPILEYLGLTEGELKAIQDHLFSRLQVDDRGIVPC